MAQVNITYKAIADVSQDNTTFESCCIFNKLPLTICYVTGATGTLMGKRLMLTAVFAGCQVFLALVYAGINSR